MVAGRDWKAEIEVLIRRLATAAGAPIEGLVGATEEQIEAVARIQGLTQLPAPHEAFLRLVGGAVTDPYLFVGETIVAPALIGDGGPSWRVERMISKGPPFFGVRPVFLDHEGWDFYYFVENRDDSPIAQISEGAKGGDWVIATDFVAWLETYTQLVEENARRRPPTDPRLKAVLPADSSTWDGAEPLARVQFELMREHGLDDAGEDWEKGSARSAALFERMSPQVAASERRHQDRIRRAAELARTATNQAIAQRSDSVERQTLAAVETIVRAAIEELWFDGGGDPEAMAESAAAAALECARTGTDTWETRYRIWTAAGRAAPPA